MCAEHAAKMEDREDSNSLKGHVCCECEDRASNALLYILAFVLALAFMFAVPAFMLYGGHAD